MTEDIINQIVKKIVSDYDPIQIWLFGSYAEGSQNTHSDIDLLIIKQTNTKPSKRPAEVQRLFYPYTNDLDILIYTPEEFELQQNCVNTIAYLIKKTGKLIYAKSIS